MWIQTSCHGKSVFQTKKNSKTMWLTNKLVPSVGPTSHRSATKVTSYSSIVSLTEYSVEASQKKSNTTDHFLCFGLTHLVS